MSLSFSFQGISQTTSEHIQVYSIGFRKSATAMKTEVEIEIKNHSSDSLLVPENPLIDFISNSGGSFGDIIVELQRKIDTGFVLFPRTADVNPGYNKTSYNTIPPNGTIKFTITIDGLSWDKKGLIAGSYRVRVYFIHEESPINLIKPSEWLYFKIN